MNTRIKQISILVLILIGGLVIVDSVGRSYYDEKTITGKVLDKERVVKDSSSYYLIYTDNETLTIQDSYVKLRFNSSDVYGRINEGNTYKFTVFGWRSGFFSMYRNILSYTPV